MMFSCEQPKRTPKIYKKIPIDVSIHLRYLHQDALHALHALQVNKDHYLFFKMYVTHVTHVTLAV